MAGECGGALPEGVCTLGSRCIGKLSWCTVVSGDLGIDQGVYRCAGRECVQDGACRWGEAGGTGKKQVSSTQTCSGSRPIYWYDIKTW